MRDELRHRLLRDLSAAGELADPRSARVEELKDVAVRRANLGMSRVGEALVQQLRANAKSHAI
jgi:hypothetical protein